MYSRLTRIGLRANGDTVRRFSSEYVLKPGLFERGSDGIMIARAPGVGEILVRPGHDPRADPFRTTRPVTVVPIQIK